MDIRERVIATPSCVKEILTHYHLPIKKRFGQNFLVEPKFIEKIVAAANITDSDYVIEIGPGLGGLTQALSQKAQQVTAIEIDRQLVPVLRDLLSGYKNIDIVEADALTVDFQALAQEHGFSAYKIVANLPYYITTPLIMKLLESEENWQTMVLMVQKEVAARITAAPGGKEYGSLSLAVQYYASTSLVSLVPPTVFIPRPNVESAVIALMPLSAPPAAIEDKELFFQVVAAAFNQRRKTLLNAVSSNLAMVDKPQLEAILLDCAIDGKRRGETLSFSEFACLANHLKNSLSSNSCS